MAETFRITYVATDIDFSPIGENYDKPDKMDRSVLDAQDGTLYMYTFYNKKLWRIPVGWMPKVDADNLNLWCENGYTVTFTPDRINDAGTTYSCKIINKSKPLSKQYGSYWETWFRGNLTLRQI